MIKVHKKVFTYKKKMIKGYSLYKEIACKLIRKNTFLKKKLSKSFLNKKIYIKLSSLNNEKIIY